MNRGTRELLAATLKMQGGLLRVKPAIVSRNSYSGRGLFATSQSAHHSGTRRDGYVPVEWWILSPIQADNPERIPGEGISQLVLDDGGLVPLTEAVEAAEQKLFGSFLGRWPLTKILDVGGLTVLPDFSSEPEEPPIPPHVHSGAIVNFRACPPGKIEAYFFPPVDVPPFNLNPGSVKTRLGLRPEARRADFVDSLSAFGRSDRMYRLLHEYPVVPYDGWTIHPGTVHAPGPWPTLEIQTPQDDFNLAAWQLGQRLNGKGLEAGIQSMVLRGLPSLDAFADQLVDWNLLSWDQFRQRFFRPAQVIEQGPWGRRLQIFFHQFYGEALELNPGSAWRRAADDRPWGGIIWSGSGAVNGLALSAEADSHREFFCTPGHAVRITNSGSSMLILYVVYPMP